MRFFLRMSPRERPKTKQKRLRQYRIVYAPIQLPDEFPVRAQGYFTQSDAPITYLHGHDCLELGYCYEGAGVFVIGDKVLPFQGGDISVITPSEFHLARSMAGTQSKWAWLYLDPIRLLQPAGEESASLGSGHLTGRSFRNIIRPQVDAPACALLRQVFEELRDRRPGYRAAARGLIQGLLVRLHRLGPKRLRREPSAGNRSMHRVAPALDLMAARYPDRLSIRDWARPCHVSPTHFRRLFRKALGQSPHVYLTELRVRMAATRLHATGEKVLVIAENTGFPTLSSFNRAFRQVMKMTPREWRARR